MTAVALAIICHDRPVELQAALDSAAGQGWDQVVVLDMASEPPIDPLPGVTLLRSDENVGVTAGRNRLVDATTAEIVFFLDDDAVLLSDVAGPVSRHFAADDRLAIVAPAVRRADGSMESSEFPFRGPADDDPTPRQCAYFVGCAYAARRDAMVAVGGYDEGFFYSTEEVDLSLRLLATGWRLLYDPTLTVEHRPSARGRSVAPRVPALRLRNRIILARRHLPLAAAAVHVSAWALRTLWESRAAGGRRLWLAAWGDGFRAAVEREPLPWPAIVRIHRLGGRVLW